MTHQKILIVIATLLFGALFGNNLEKRVEQSDPQLIQFNSQRLSNLYSPNYIHACEIIYGSEGMISQGGFASVDRMFAGVDLEGKKVLDVGCGLGGMDIYLAKKYAVDIIGVDKEAYMTDQASLLLSQECGSLIGKVSFQCLKSPVELVEFPDNAFDIVTCKEMLYHVPTKDKQAYLNEMYRVVKPGGQIVIADWNSEAREIGDHLKQAIRVEGFCYFVTPDNFRAMLENARFVKISQMDVSKDHFDDTLSDIERMKDQADEISFKATSQMLEHVKVSWKLFLKAIESGELKASLFVGTKA